MNGTLYVLAQAAAPAAPTNPIASLLGGVLPVLAGAVIGYVLGLLRDASKAKADREARHQEVILGAASELLALGQRIDRESKMLMGNLRLARSVTDSHPNPESDMKALIDDAYTRFGDAVTAQMAGKTEAQTHLLKLSILAPKLTPAAEQLILAAAKLLATSAEQMEPEELARLDAKRGEEYAKAVSTFTAKTQKFLKVKAS